jgi:hypothetical protein
MNYKLLIIFFSQILLLGSVKSQDRSLVHCKSQKVAFTIENGEKGIIFMVSDTSYKKLDTVLISHVTYDIAECFCNDTLATFIDNSSSSARVTLLRYTNGKWAFESLRLPDRFPMIGMVIDGSQYNSNSYRLASVNKIVSEQTVLVGQEGRLVPVERYDIEYEIRLRNKESDSHPMFPQIKISKRFLYEVYESKRELKK